MKKVVASVCYGLVWLYACIPLPILFFLNDILVFPLVYHVGRYRLRVVRQNLKNSFPDQSDKDLKQMERRFYRHFCDTFQETIRVLAMSKKEALHRMAIVNPEVVTDFAKKGQGVLVVLGHYGNWEYQPFLFLHMLANGNQRGYNIYRPLKNHAFDELMKKVRGHFGGTNITKNDTYRTVIRLRKEGIAGVFGLVSDQSPSVSSLHYWTRFLNQDTAILTGPERMAKQTGFAVVYADVSKLSRGCYQTEYRLLSDRPGETNEFEITEQYARCMEQTILREPAYWLWSHKRWKHKRTEV